MAKIVNPQQFKWYRYLGREPVVLPDAHEEYDIEIDTRELLGLRFEKKKFYLLHQDLLEEEMPIEEADVKLIINNSRSYTGKIGNKDVPKGQSFAELTGEKAEESKRSSTDITGRAKTGKELIQDVPIVYKPIGSRSKPKQIRFTIESTDKVFPSSFGDIKPLDDGMQELLQEASKYIGLLKPIKSDLIRIGQNNGGTMLLTTTNMRSLRKAIYIALDKKQLARINNGKLDSSIIASAITHELGHYLWNEGVVRTSDKMRWKKQIAGLRFHKDQYNHGQGYPWYEEHFAMMCEYMVHGRSARGLQSTIGWEIVAKYFDNVYLKDGGK